MAAPRLSVLCLSACAHFPLASSASAGVEENPFFQETRLMAQTDTDTSDTSAAARSLSLECAPTNSVNSCLVQHCTDQASATACLEGGGDDPDCCATMGMGSCKAGFTQARAHASTCNSIVGASTTCCYDLTALGMTQTQLSSHLTQNPVQPGVGSLTCSDAWCTSPGVIANTNDCLAGSDVEKCTCSQGEAVQLPETYQSGGKTYYRYTCCNRPADGGTLGANFVGEECGDYDSTAAIIAILIIVLIIVCCCCGAGVIVWKCCLKKNGANRQMTRV